MTPKMQDLLTNLYTAMSNMRYQSQQILDDCKGYRPYVPVSSFRDVETAYYNLMIEVPKFTKEDVAMLPIGFEVNMAAIHTAFYTSLIEDYDYEEDFDIKKHCIQKLVDVSSVVLEDLAYILI